MVACVYEQATVQPCLTQTPPPGPVSNHLLPLPSQPSSYHTTTTPPSSYLCAARCSVPLCPPVCSCGLLLWTCIHDKVCSSVCSTGRDCGGSFQVGIRSVFLLVSPLSNLARVCCVFACLCVLRRCCVATQDWQCCGHHHAQLGNHIQSRLSGCVGVVHV